ncbi:hypothetical protein EDC04DRAFT_112778 [Pisolithus marmoratus]|nr:hypothetical protein EDC04DRAFT_112778 [Pisolithus marmoratus]
MSWRAASPTSGQYLALLTVADAFMVTSLREGMALRTHDAACTYCYLQPRCNITCMVDMVVKKMFLVSVSRRNKDSREKLCCFQKAPHTRRLGCIGLDQRT